MLSLVGRTSQNLDKKKTLFEDF